jgi:lysophospholipase L1-like esterase
MNPERRTILLGGLAAALAASAAKAQVAPPPPPVFPPSTVPALDEVRLHTDWGYRERYRAEDEAVLAGPPAVRRVVFLGDSITEGWTGMHPGFFIANGFVGRGIGGQTSPQMLVRFRQDVIGLQPQAVHIMAGTNDIAENTGPYDPQATQGYIASMAELAKAHGIRVILASVPPAGEFFWHPGLGPADKIRTLNGWLKDYAVSNGFTYADYTAILDNGTGAMKPGLASDGVHPTLAGYTVMEPIALQAVAAGLA